MAAYVLDSGTLQLCIDLYFRGSYRNVGRGYSGCFLVSKSFKEVVLLCGMLPLPTELWNTSRKAMYAYTDQTHPAGPAGIEVLLAGSLGEVKHGLMHSL